MNPIHLDSLKRSLILGTILFIGFWIRYCGIWFSYPLQTHPDEPLIVMRALHMVNSGDLNPHGFNYPSLNIYLNALIIRFVRFFSFSADSDIPLINYYIAGRCLNVFFAVVSIFLTFKSTQLLFNTLSGLCAAWFISFSTLHISHSSFVTVDNSVGLWMIASFYIGSLLFIHGKKMKYYVFGGLFCGFAISSKYTAFISALSIFVAHLNHCRRDKKWIDKNIIVFGIVSVLAFILTTPYALLDLSTFYDHVIFEVKHYSKGHLGSESFSGNSYAQYSKYLFYSGYGIIPSILALLGFMAIIKKDWFKALFVISAAFSLFILVGKFKVYFFRNIVGIIPFLAILSGVFVGKIGHYLINLWQGKRSYIPAVLLTLILCISVGQNVLKKWHKIEQQNLPDTRYISIDWIENNIPLGAKIGREHYTPPIEEFTDVFDVKFLGITGALRKDQLQDLDYLIISSIDYKRFFNSDHYPEQRAYYSNLLTTGKIIYELSKEEGVSSGPTLSILQLKE